MPAPIAEVDAAVAQEAEVEAPAAPEPPVDDTPPRPYTVFHEHVALDINLRDKIIKGHVDIFISTQEALSEVFIDARQCDIDVKNITVSYCPANATYNDPYDKVDTPEPYEWDASQWAIRKHRMRPLMHRRRNQEATAMEHEERLNCHPVDESVRVTIPSVKDMQASLAKHKEERARVNRQEVLDQWVDQWDKAIEENVSALHKISIPFVLKNIRDGLQFVGIDEADTRYPHLYTRHALEPGTACSIFPCIDDPGCRSSWRVSLTFPRTLGDAFQQTKTPQPQTNGTAAATSIVSRKRKLNEEEPRRHQIALTEEDKLLELTAVCSGKLEDEVIDQHDETKKTMTFTSTNKAARHIGFALGPFEHVDLWSEFRTEEDDEKLGSNATKVHGYCLPGRADNVRNSCAALVTAMDHFALNYGRYPFDNYKMCFVDDMVSQTVPLCGFSLCSNRVLFPREIIDYEIDVTRTLVHALASQWFGITIVPDKKSDIWLVAGIAWFMTDLFMKSLCGNNWYRFRMKEQADYLVTTDFKRPSLESLGDHLHLGDFEVNFLNLKANLVLFILDRRLSKSSGSAGIARIIAKMIQKANTSSMPADEILASDMFRKACEKHGQTRLEGFWAQWIKGCGCPRFDVHQKFNKKKLCVEMNVRQIQDIAHGKVRQLDRDDFWREVVEETHTVWAADVHHCFTGPMTIRIHEADGTPYEHIVEIRDDTGKTAQFQIPYNTKYKRLKRNRRQRERQIAGNAAKPSDENAEDSLIYCLGDVLQGEEDVERWSLTDWEPEMEAKMDQESYEWIRMDADFEWICSMQTNMQSYMYVSQLQQDRDVVAQQDSMLYLGTQSSKRPHPLISTILTRTLVDARYYHGIRTMSADILCQLGLDVLNQIGLKHLMQSFQFMFCYGDDNKPRPNDFSDKRQYMVQCAIPAAIARVRDKNGHCPKEARHFILQQLQSNNNAENLYSDHLYICKLIDALAVSLVPDEKQTKDQPMSFSFGDEEEEDEAASDPEPQNFKEMALEEIDRYRRMDEYSPSFQNCFTVAALGALGRLMKAKVIPLDPLIFTQYLQDQTIDVVRIKAFEALIELNFLSKPVFLRFFLSIVSTDRSPFVRDQLFKLFCRGLASIAIGEHDEEEKPKPVSNDDGLIVEQESGIIEAKQKLKARRENLTAALSALKEVTKDDETLQEVVWNALDSPILTVAERRNILDLCSILFEEDDQLVVRFKYPEVWTAHRGPIQRGKLLMNFKRHYRTKSRKAYAPPLIARPEPPKRTITLNLNRAPSFKAATVGSPKPASPSAQPPAQSAKPVVSAKPAASTKPTIPTKPVVSVSTKPAVPNKPAVPAAKPVVPTKPTISTKPVGSPKPLLSNKPSGSAKPDGLTKPSGSAKADGPAKPAGPSKPVISTKPAGSPKPVVSSKPVIPAKPSLPGKLAVPAKPVISMKTGASAKPAVSAKPTEKPASSPALPKSASPPPAKEPQRDSISVQPPRPSIEVPAGSNSERKALPGAPGKPQQSTIHKIQTSKGQGQKIHISKPVHKTSVPPKINTNGGDSRSSSLAPQSAKNLKRPSSEATESPRPSKLVKLNVKGFPASVFRKRTKIVKLPFKRWDRLKVRKPTNASEAGSIRAAPKGVQSKKEKPGSIIVGSPAHSQSPRPFSPKPSTSSPGILSNKKSATPPIIQRSSSNSGISKPARKPLPSSGVGGSSGGGGSGGDRNSGGDRGSGDRGGGGDRSGGGDRGSGSGGGGSSSSNNIERKPLPSGGSRTALPSSGSHPTPSQPSAGSSSSAPASAPPKLKFKIKVKPKQPTG